MGPPGFMALSAATADPKYLEFADSEYTATKDYLFYPFDADEDIDTPGGLYLRDSTFLPEENNVDDNGNLIFWSRGNGWVFAGLPAVLRAMPADFAGRAMCVFVLLCVDLLACVELSKATTGIIIHSAPRTPQLLRALSRCSNHAPMIFQIKSTSHGTVNFTDQQPERLCMCSGAEGCAVLKNACFGKRVPIWCLVSAQLASLK